MVNKVGVTFVAMNGGYSFKQNGVVDVSLRCDYSELSNCIRLLQMLNNDIKIAIKTPDDKQPLKLGMFRLKSVNVSSDGESKLNFTSTVESVEYENINKLMTDERFNVRCVAEVEIEEEEETE